MNRLNLKFDEHKQQLLTLLEDTDLLIESFRPGTMENLGLGIERLKTLG